MVANKVSFQKLINAVKTNFFCTTRRYRSFRSGSVNGSKSKHSAGEGLDGRNSIIPVSMEAQEEAHSLTGLAARVEGSG